MARPNIALTVAAFGETLKVTTVEWREDDAPRLAAALAYYTALALAPLLAVTIAVASIIIGESDPVRVQVVAQVEAAAGTQAAQMVDSLVRDGSGVQGGAVAAVVGTVTLLVGATGAFSQLKYALNRIWDVEQPERAGIWRRARDRFLAFMMVLGTGLVLLLSIATSAMLDLATSYLGAQASAPLGLTRALELLTSLGITVVVFAALFRVLPDVDLLWRDVMFGALFTAVLFTGGKELLGLYLSKASVFSVYGAAGSMVVILVWVYYSAQILFFGAEFTQVYARRHSPNAARFDTHSRE